MNKQYYNYEEFIQDINTFTIKLQNQKIDTIVGIARGGLTLSHFLAIKLNIKNVQSINAVSYDNQIHKELTITNIPNIAENQTILLVDDISDSGKTFTQVVKKLKLKNININIVTLSIFYKKTSSFKPDIYLHQNTNWVEFFWEYNKIQTQN